MREEDCNILVNLSREEYREFRALVIDMVLATDMSCHFQQIKAAKSLLTVPELRHEHYIFDEGNNKLQFLRQSDAARSVGCSGACEKCIGQQQAPKHFASRHPELPYH